MEKALLVIDMQNICVGENHAKLFKYDNEALISEVNKIIDGNKDNLVIYIQNVMKKNLLNKFAPFHAYEGTNEVKLVSNLSIISNYIFKKYVGDAFSNREFALLLKEKGVKVIEVVGVDGGGCVSVTALGAVKSGYKVIVNTKAIGTMFEKNRDKYFKELQELGAEFV